MLCVEIVDEDEVEIGGRGHLAGTELAEREDRGLLARQLTVRAHEIVSDRAVK